MRSKIIVGTFAVFLMTSAGANAAASKAVAEESILCSGLFYILTSVSGNEGAQRPAMLLGGIYDVHAGQLSGRSVNNGFVFEARDNAANRLSRMYDEDPNAVIEQYLRCNFWLVNLGEYFQQSGLFSTDQPPSEDKIDQIILGVPEASAPHEVPPSDRDLVEGALAKAFGAWTANGRMTRQKLKEQLTKKATE